MVNSVQNSHNTTYNHAITELITYVHPTFIKGIKNGEN